MNLTFDEKTHRERDATDKYVYVLRNISGLHRTRWKTMTEPMICIAEDLKRNEK